MEIFQDEHIRMEELENRNAYNLAIEAIENTDID